MNSTGDSDELHSGTGEVGVFGFGNPLRGDDGIVAVLFDRVRSQAPDIDATFLEFGSRTFRVVHAIREFDRVLLVDAMEFGGEPGEVVVCSPDEIQSRTETTGSHGLDLLELLELGTQLPNPPVKIRLFGIQPGPMELESGLSEPVKNRIPDIAVELQETIAEL